jgi:hypothetical protein
MDNMTPQQQLENVNRLIAFWATVDPAFVNLRLYECGSCACVGGWVARAGLFGVYMNFEGFPAMAGTPAEIIRYRVGSQLAGYLFGDFKLFGQRREHPTDNLHEWDVPDYEVAKARMEFAKANLERKCQDVHA